MAASGASESKRLECNHEKAEMQGMSDEILYYVGNSGKVNESRWSQLSSTRVTTTSPTRRRVGHNPGRIQGYFITARSTPLRSSRASRAISSQHTGSPSFIRLLSWQLEEAGAPYASRHPRGCSFFGNGYDFIAVVPWAGDENVVCVMVVAEAEAELAVM